MKVLEANISREEKIKSFNKRIVRWDAYRVNFLSFIINLILTLTGGSLIFWYSVLKDERAYFCNLWLLISGMLLALSFFFGIATMLNRLCDFRLTVKKIRFEKVDFQRNAIQPSRQVKELKRRTKEIGDRTYLLLCFQVGLFAIGNMIIFLSILTAYN
jgi:hypothetical protein